MFKSCTIKLIFVVSIALFLPIIIFAYTDVVGYSYGKDYVNESNYMSFPSSLQLDRLTHVIASDIGCEDDGSLFIGKLPNYWDGTPPPLNIWNGNKNEWLESLINRAHAKGVKVSICVGGDTTYFPQATHSANLTTFASNIVDFVNVHGFDGVDIDWERPRNLTEWNQCIALLQSLRNEMPTKRITIALPHSTWFYPNITVQQLILNNVHGIHLMTYDEGDSAWPSHSNVAKSIDAINEWISWQTPTCAEKKKLFLGSAFYGWHPVVGGSGQRISYFDYILNNDTRWNSNPGDLTTNVKDKAIHTRDNGFGGVFIWELGYDLPADHSQSLLKAIDEVMPYSSGPSFVCNTNTPFTLSNPPAGSTISWSKSNNLTYVSGQDSTQYKVKAASSSTSGTGWVQATINGTCGSIQFPPHSVWVGKPTLPTVNPSKGIEMTTADDLLLTLTNTPGASSSSGQWSASGVLYPTYSSFTTGNACFFSADVPGTVQAMVTTSNVCGPSPMKYIYVLVQDNGDGGGPFTISPNPASNEINLIFDEQQSINSENNISHDVEMNYSVRIVNNFGLVYFSGNMYNNNLNINISNWEKGFYHVFITNNDDSFSSTFIVN